MALSRLPRFEMGNKIRRGSELHHLSQHQRRRVLLVVFHPAPNNAIELCNGRSAARGNVQGWNVADAREESTAGFGSGIAYDYDSKYRVFLGGGDGKVRRDSIGEIAIQKNTLTFRPRALIESERVALVPPFK